MLAMEAQNTNNESEKNRIRNLYGTLLNSILIDLARQIDLTPAHMPKDSYLNREINAIGAAVGGSSQMQGMLQALHERLKQDPGAWTTIAVLLMQLGWQLGRVLPPEENTQAV